MLIDLPEFLKCHKVACGQRHVLALVSAEEEGEGQVWGVGDNRHGQLAADHTGSTQQLIVGQLLSHLRFSHLHCGWSHAAAITGTLHLSSFTFVSKNLFLYRYITLHYRYITGTLHFSSFTFL